MRVFHNASLAEKHGPQYLGFENQSRLVACLDAINAQVGTVCGVQEIGPAPWETLEVVHSRSYVEELRRQIAVSSATKTPIEVGEEALVYPASDKAILSGVGSALAALEYVLSEDQRFAMSLARPPGHHAEPHQARGYCFASTAGIVARRARALGRRVAIFDFDLHQGNGTERAVRNVDGILFCEIHLEGEGEYPWKTRPVSNPYQPPPPAENVYKIALPPLFPGQHYVKIFAEEILPRLKAFQPQLIVCSAGFDCLDGDPVAKRGPLLQDEGGFKLFPRHITEITSELGRLNVPIVSILEGGYHIEHLCEGVIAHLDGVMRL